MIICKIILLYHCKKSRDKFFIMKLRAKSNDFALASGFPPIVVPRSAHHPQATFCLKGVIMGISKKFIRSAPSDLILK